MENRENELIESFSFTEEEKLQFEQLERKRIKYLGVQIEKVQRENDQLRIAQTIQGEEIKLIRNDLIKQAEKQSYATERVNDKHVTQTGLGSNHVPKIGTIYMGHLLRKTGIARKDFTTTMPKSEFTTGKTAMIMSRSNNGFISYVFHVDRTWKLIRNKLTESNLIFSFENCKTTDEIHSFIDKMGYLQ